jgi:HlyD family secretion protein
VNGKTLILIALAAVMAGGCVNRAAQQQAKRTQAIVTDQTKVVTTSPALTKTLYETLPITGEVTTSEDASVGAKVPGRVVAVYVRDGDSVYAGQVIAQLDSSNQMIQVQQAQAQVNSAQSQLNQAMSNARITPQRTTAAVAQAQAQVRAAKAQLAKAISGARPEERNQAKAAADAAKSNMDTAKKQRDRQLSLLREGAVSQQQFEQAENAYQAALSQYEQALQQVNMMSSWSRPEDIESAREQVRQAEEAVKTAQANKSLDVILGDQVRTARATLQGAVASLNLARQGLEDSKIRAPFSGKISGKPVQAGTVISGGNAVARIIGASGTYFEGEFPAGALEKIKMGSIVTVKIDGLEGRTFVGSVITISPSASSVGRLFKARVQIGNSPDLKPGMFARGEVTLRTVDGATVAPTAAIIKRGDKSVLFTVKGDTAKLVEVVPGLTTDGYTQIDKVAPGDQVVVKGQNDLDDGSKVKLEKGA